MNNSLFSSEKMSWETPQALFDNLDSEFHFTLDACASKDNAKCDRYFDETADGLSQEWRGTVWCNPPYGRGINAWVEKAFHSSCDGATVVCLVPVRSDTRWWHDWVMRAEQIRLFTRRLTFGGASNKATFPACLVVFSPHTVSGPELSAYKV